MSIFNKIKELPCDPIINLTTLYKEDTRKDKIDIGVGVFKDENGNTPIMSAVKKAEKEVYSSEMTKAYVGICGNKLFNKSITNLILKDSVDEERIASASTPGGSGAIRVMSDFLYRLENYDKVYLSDPTWGNHAPIFEAAGFKTLNYPYLDRDKKLVNEDKMSESIKNLTKNDILVLHGCCHNPSGSDISKELWEEIATLSNSAGFLVFVDFAYQGFGQGLDEDTEGLRAFAEIAERFIVTISCSKNFGLYKDRTGCTVFVGKDKHEAKAIQSHIACSNRVAYSMPPDHGEAIAAKILSTPELYKEWEAELSQMRNRIKNTRKLLANEFRIASNTDKWDFIERHNGMFSLLCIPDDVHTALVNDSIYLVKGGRINIAGFRSQEQIKRFAESVTKAYKK